MELSNTPVSQRVHIAFFGCVNAGKSSVVNAFVNQEVSLVSDKMGTTTDAVKKTMELLPLGPVVVFDTAGFDDESELGKLRIEKTKQILDKTDIAVLVVDSTKGKTTTDNELVKIFETKKIPFIIAYNKADLVNEKKQLQNNEIYVSAKTKENVEQLKEKIANLINKNKKEKLIVADLLNKKDIVILVCPIDESAPKGRLILPQQLTLRELLDFHCSTIVVQVEELKDILNKITPKLVITDSQVFGEVSKIVPKEIALTSFSILFARYKGELKALVEGAIQISKLKENDFVLISEGCTHHRQCNDIGSVKIPKWLMDYTNKKLNFEFTQGGQFPSDLSKYSLIIHCGACMLNETEMKNRIQKASNQQIPIVNYGILIAFLKGILNRNLEFFPEIYNEFKNNL